MEHALSTTTFVARQNAAAGVQSCTVVTPVYGPPETLEVQQRSTDRRQQPVPMPVKRTVQKTVTITGQQPAERPSERAISRATHHHVTEHHDEAANDGLRFHEEEFPSASSQKRKRRPDVELTDMRDDKTDCGAGGFQDDETGEPYVTSVSAPPEVVDLQQRSRVVEQPEESENVVLRLHEEFPASQKRQHRPVEPTDSTVKHDTADCDLGVVRNAETGVQSYVVVMRGPPEAVDRPQRSHTVDHHDQATTEVIRFHREENFPPAFQKPQRHTVGPTETARGMRDCDLGGVQTGVPSYTLYGPPNAVNHRRRNQIVDSQDESANGFLRGSEEFPPAPQRLETTAHGVQNGPDEHRSWSSHARRTTAQMGVTVIEQQHARRPLVEPDDYFGPVHRSNPESIAPAFQLDRWRKKALDRLSAVDNVFILETYSVNEFTLQVRASTDETMFVVDTKPWSVSSGGTVTVDEVKRRVYRMDDETAALLNNRYSRDFAPAALVRFFLDNCNGVPIIVSSNFKSLLAKRLGKCFMEYLVYSHFLPGNQRCQRCDKRAVAVVPPTSHLSRFETAAGECFVMALTHTHTHTCGARTHNIHNLSFIILTK